MNDFKIKQADSKNIGRNSDRQYSEEKEYNNKQSVVNEDLDLDDNFLSKDSYTDSRDVDSVNAIPSSSTSRYDDMNNLYGNLNTNMPYGNQSSSSSNSRYGDINNLYSANTMSDNDE